MSERDAIIRVDLDDALSDVLDRVESADGSAVRLVIPAGSSLFLTAIEFRTLKDAADRRSLALIVETADPLRLQLAAMFGLNAGDRKGPAIVKPERFRPKFAKIVNLADRARRKTGASAVAVTAAPVATWPANAWTAGATPSGSHGAAETAVAVVAARSPVEQSATDVPAPQTSREADVAATLPALGEPPPTVADEVATPSLATSAPRQALAADGRNAVAIGAPDAVMRPASSRRKLLVRPNKWLGRLAIALAILLVAGLVGFVLAALYLPRATVAIVLAKQLVSTEATYRIVAPDATAGDDAILTITAESTSREIAFELVGEATGVRRDPDAVAHGQVRLANPTAQPVTVEPGTIIASDGGVEYLFPERVVVPAGDPNRGTSGGVSSTIQAVVGGAIANLDVGDLSGRLDTGVYYSNRTEPIAGGTDREVRVVTQEDLDALRVQAAAELPKRATEEFSAQLGPNGQIIPASLQLGEEVYGFSHSVGQEAANVTARVTLPVTALTFDEARVRQAATERVRAQLTAAAPAGFTVTGADVRLDQPVAVTEQADRIEYRVTGSADATARFTDADRSALRETLRGKDAAAAEEVLRANPTVDRFSFRYTPDWLPHRMPRSAAGIAIETTT